MELLRELVGAAFGRLRPTFVFDTSSGQSLNWKWLPEEFHRDADRDY